MPSVEAKYRKVVDTLVKEIASGKYGVQTQFPSVAMLIRRFGISNLTAVKVLDQLKQKGLVRSYQGRGTFVTRQAAARKIGLIMPDVAQSEYFARIFRELQRLSEREDYELLVGEVRGESVRARVDCVDKLVSDLIRQHVSGVVFQPIEYCAGGDAHNRKMLARLDAAKIPVVLCDDDVVSGDGRYDVVGVSNIDAGARMYRHLIEAGARRVCYFMRPCSPRSHLDRARGFVLSVLGGLTGAVRKESVLVVEPDDARAVRRCIKADKVDAFMCGDDETAAKLIQTINKLGYAVPADVMVAGFNDLNIASLLTPTLTTLRVNCEQIASAVFERIVYRMTNKTAATINMHLSAELVVRESTAGRSMVRRLANRKRKEGRTA